MSNKALKRDILRLASCFPVHRNMLVSLIGGGIPVNRVEHILESRIESFEEDFTETSDLPPEQEGHGSNELYLWQTGASAPERPADEMLEEFGEEVEEESMDLFHPMNDGFSW